MINYILLNYLCFTFAVLLMEDNGVIFLTYKQVRLMFSNHKNITCMMFPFCWLPNTGFFNIKFFNTPELIEKNKN